MGIDDIIYFVVSSICFCLLAVFFFVLRNTDKKKKKCPGFQSHGGDEGVRGEGGGGRYACGK